MNKPTENGLGAILVPEWGRPDPDFKFPTTLVNQFVFLREAPLRALPVANSGPIHTRPNSEDKVVEVYPDAIAVVSPIAVTDRRYLHRFGLGGNLLAVAGCLMLSLMLFSSMHPAGPDAVDVIFRTIFLGAALLFALGAMRNYRMLALPPHWPVVFNRKTRQISYFNVNMPSFFRFRKPVATERPMCPVTRSGFGSAVRRHPNRRPRRCAYGSDADGRAARAVVERSAGQASVDRSARQSVMSMHCGSRDGTPLQPFTTTQTFTVLGPTD